MINFKANLVKANNNGTGIIRISKDNQKLFKRGEQVKVTIITKKGPIYFFSKITSFIGVYIPKEIMNDDMLGEQQISFERTNYILMNIGSDGRVYIPNSIGNNLNLNENDILNIELEIENLDMTTYPKIKIRKKSNTTEYFFHLQKDFYNKKAMIKNISRFNKNKISFSHKLDLSQILSGFTFAELDNKQIILYLGNRMPVIINSNVLLKEISHFLGCFFADGTKKGNDWGICASTFEQAVYFKKMHKLIVPDNNINFSLTITISHGKEVDIDKIIRLWGNNCEVNITSKQVIISKSDGFTNRNKFGTLIFKEHRQTTQIYYNKLIEFLLSIIKKEKNVELAKDFICGVIEGDGCLNAKGRGHIQITSNDREVKVIEEFLKYTNLDFHMHKEKSTGKVYINIGGMSIIEDIEFLGKILFKYYPKRRKILSERLCNTPAAKYLMGKQLTLSSWILKRFRDKDILDKNNKLTPKGEKIKNALLELGKEI